MNKTEILEKLLGNLLDTNADHSGYHFIAELKEENFKGLTSSIDTNTVLISPRLIKKIKPSQGHPNVTTPGASYHPEYVYKPSFWIFLTKATGLNKTEPLAVSWDSGNHTTLMPDQGFLSAFKLTPTYLNEEVHWNDLNGPEYKVILNKPLSEFYFTRKSSAFVKIRKDYLEAYAALRKKTAVQVFTIIKEIEADDNLEMLTAGDDNYIEEFKQFEIRLSRYLHKPNIFRMEINGYKILAEHNPIKEISAGEPAGHFWKNIEGSVDGWRARHELPGEQVYVADSVLAKYEGNDDYEIYPDSGAVSYGGKWSVGHCKRVGRNAIQLDLKKLYEGNTDEVITHWNKFNIDRSAINFAEEHIPQKAKRLVRRYFLMGRLLAGTLNRILPVHYTAAELITLDEARINYTGWTEFPDYGPVANHVDAERFTREQFLGRAKKLQILLIENLKVAALRRSVNALGFPLDDTKKYGSLKLLDLVLSYFITANETGLNAALDMDEIRQQMSEKPSKSFLSPLFALNDLRQLDAHKTNDIKSKLNTSLKVLDIEPNSIANNYADAIGLVFDRLTDAITNVNDRLSILET
jgi:hypothetical protein